MLSDLIRKGGLAQLATATPATLATDSTPAPSTVASVATVAVAQADAAGVEEASMPDDWSTMLMEVAELPSRYPVDDDRRHCACCRNLTGGGLCLAARRGELQTSETYRPLDDLPRRCGSYLPAADDPDQRSGSERWPGLTRDSTDF